MHFVAAEQVLHVGVHGVTEGLPADQRPIGEFRPAGRLAKHRYSRFAGDAMSELTLIAGVRGKIEIGS
ncbi:MAG: hypothetical protein O7G83_17615 [Proteobacteria bacterium]|nr:hypothetical protein [Pseudomonadota bacterium]